MREKASAVKENWMNKTKWNCKQKKIIYIDREFVYVFDFGHRNMWRENVKTNLFTAPQEYTNTLSPPSCIYTHTYTTNKFLFCTNRSVHTSQKNNLKTKSINTS